MDRVLVVACVVVFALLLAISLCWVGGKCSRQEEAEERKKQRHGH